MMRNKRMEKIDYKKDFEEENKNNFEKDFIKKYYWIDILSEV